MDGTGNYYVKRNRPDTGRQVLHAVCHIWKLESSDGWRLGGQERRGAAASSETDKCQSQFPMFHCTEAWVSPRRRELIGCKPKEIREWKGWLPTLIRFMLCRCVLLKSFWIKYNLFKERAFPICKGKNNLGGDLEADARWQVWGREKWRNGDKGLQ